MKSGGPWNLRGLRPEARAAAREAARRSGMSVGEWLNTVIQPADEDDESWWSGEVDREPDDRWRPHSRVEERERARYRDDHEVPPPWRRREHFEDDERPARRRTRPNREDDRGPGGPYRSEHERTERPRRERPRHDEGAAPARRAEDARNAPIDDAIAERLRRERPRHDEGAAPPRGAEDARDASIDHAIAEIEARQRALDTDATAEIKARQRALDGEAAPDRSFGEREAQPLPPRPEPGYSEARYAEAPFDLSGLEHQLRQITGLIETLQPTGGLQVAIDALRNDLAEIGHTLTEALPRRALESLEIEVKALAQRIDHTRHSGVDGSALAGVERGLADVREALQRLTPAENLVGFEQAVRALATRVDAIVAREDPATLQQLETAIGGLRGIVSHVASNDTLTKVAEDVRALSAKVDGLANSSASVPALAALENRIDTLAGAINASTEAGHAVPRELEKLLSGLIEKLEWVQLTQTDHTALAHLEDRIASLVKRLDVSDARLGLLEGVERGLADLLVYIEQLRNGAAPAAPVVAPAPVAVGAIEQEVAEIKQTERRTQDSLEDVQGTVEHVVDRLAMIESDMRADKEKPAATEPLVEPEPELLAAAPLIPPAPLEHPADEVEAMIADAAADAEAITPPLQPDATPRPARPPQRPTKPRTPIDPSLPPDHPLEPGSAAGRSRGGPSAAERIAASEAAVGSKPPVIADPGGGKPDFIGAARRAAKAAALSASEDRANAKAGVATTVPAKKLTERLRTIAVAVAVVVIIAGGFHIVTRLFEDGGSNPPPPAPAALPRVLTEPPRLQPNPKPLPLEPPQVQTEPLPPAATAPEGSPAPAIIQGEPVDAVQNPSAPAPGVPPAPAISENPGPQSSLNPPDGESPSVTLAQPTDITGSLPKTSAKHPPIAPAPMGTDRLPSAIGEPALRDAALAGDPYAAYEVAVRFVEGHVVPINNQEAARWFDIAAKKGLAPAEFRLGTLYEKGLGVKKDLAMARDLYRASADQGHGKAMHNLAVLYAEGVDGKPDYRAAAQWFRKAADRGVADSQFNLAVLYARGVGVEQSFAESYKWFFLAARDGDQDAAQKRDEVAAHLDARTLEAARIAAEKWTPLPQPAEAITVKGAWDAPAAPARPKGKSAKTPAVDAAKVN